MMAKKRRRGTGSVFRHGSSLWIAYYVDGNQIKERIGPIGLVTKGQAEEALKVRMAEVVQGRYNLQKEIKSISFENLLDKYLEWAKVNHKSPNRDFEIAKPLLNFFGGKKLNEINTWLVEKYKSERKKDLKPATVNRELGVLKRMFNLAILWEMTSDNPVKGIKFLTVNNTIPRTLKEWEFSKLYELAPEHLKPILLCAYLAGLRKGELLNLKWNDVDFTDNYIFVRESKNNDVRAVPIAGSLREVLTKLKEKSDCEHVFTTDKGSPYIHKGAFKRSWNTALKKSGIEKCRFHDLRHTFVSNLYVNLKLDAITVMKLSGHKDIRMLERYSHTREELKRDAIMKLDGNFNSTISRSNNHATMTNIK